LSNEDVVKYQALRRYCFKSLISWYHG